jgi:hypothetical protein
VESVGAVQGGLIGLGEKERRKIIDPASGGCGALFTLAWQFSFGMWRRGLGLRG